MATASTLYPYVLARNAPEPAGVIERFGERRGFRCAFDRGVTPWKRSGGGSGGPHDEGQHPLGRKPRLHEGWLSSSWALPPGELESIHNARRVFERSGEAEGAGPAFDVPIPSPWDDGLPARPLRA